MYYLEYHELLKKYKKADKAFYDALDSRQKLLYLVSPHGVQPKEIVNYLSNPSPDAKFAHYSSEIDKIDKLVNSTRNTRDMLEYELKKKEIDLKQSDDPHDKIYVWCWLKHKKPSQVYKLIPCSRSSAYNYKDEIKEKLQELKEKNKKK